MEADIRHQQYTLFYSGMAVLFFGIWGILKLCIKFYHNPITIDPELLDPGEDAQFALLLLILLYVALIAIDSIIRLYIGLCAVSEGRGRWKHSVYLVITAVYLIVNILLSYSTLEPSWLTIILQLSSGLFTASELPRYTILSPMI